MLIGFSVSNFRSFNSSQSISFKPSKISRHKNHVCEIGEKKDLKSALIYGANAGGKSNLIKALHKSDPGFPLTDTDNARLFQFSHHIAHNHGVCPYASRKKIAGYGFPFRKKLYNSNDVNCYRKLACNLH